MQVIYLTHKFKFTKDYPYPIKGKPAPSFRSLYSITASPKESGLITSEEDFDSIEKVIEAIKTDPTKDENHIKVILGLHPIIKTRETHDQDYIWDYKIPSKDSLTYKRLKQAGIDIN